MSSPPTTLGIEEEYLFVDPATGDLVNDPPSELIAECTERGAGQISPWVDGLARASLPGGRECGTICASLFSPDGTPP